MNTKVQQYIEKKGVLEKPEILSMTKEQTPSVLLMKDAQKFIDKIKQYLLEKKRICVIGDYDTDGVCSTSVTVRCLRQISKGLTGSEGKISYYIPHRFEDGYGLSQKVIDKVLLKNPKTEVLVTCDNGIVAFDAVDYANSKGLKVLVTDHHLAKEDGQLPKAEAIVNPNRVDDEYPFKGISGTIVVYKLFVEFAKQHLPENVKDFEQYIDFAGMSVVSDVMPVLYESRYYLKEALKIFNGEGEFLCRFAWKAMIESLRSSRKLDKDKELTEKDFGFIFSPMINAQSRVYGLANHGVETFLSTSTDDVREKVQFLIKVNEERKKISNSSFERINQTDYTGKPVIIIRDDELGDGFIGLIAGKLTEKYNRPSVVFTKNHDGSLKGSARGIEGYNLIEDLDCIRPLVIKMGGHLAAAGLSIPEDNFSEFVSVLEKHYSEIIPEDLPNSIEPDFALRPHEFTVDFIRDLNQFAPFGEGLEYPNISIKNLKVLEIKEMGQETKKGSGKPHIKFKTKYFDVVSWNAAQSIPEGFSESGKIAVVGTPEENHFQGSKTLQIVATPNNITYYEETGE